MKTILIYDGSFDGLLSSVFYVYERKLSQVSIKKKCHHVANFFDSEEIVSTNPSHAARVWKGLSADISKQGMFKLYKAYLSEIPHIENIILQYIRKALASNKNIEKDFGDKTILEIEQIVKQIDREKHRMDAFIRFRLTLDGIYFAEVEPDFNVLPLNVEHFKKRYADQKWIIYDAKRKYGFYYDLTSIQKIELEFSRETTLEDQNKNQFQIEDFHFQKLWSNYYKTSTIASRKNTRLHIKHIPKRYWKYLTEKNF